MDSLMPKSDSARLRGQSQMDFKTATTGVAAKAMRNEISNLVKTVSDPATKKVPSRPRAPAITLLTRSPAITGVRHRDAVLLLSLHALPRQARIGAGDVRPLYILISLLTLISTRPQRLGSHQVPQ